LLTSTVLVTARINAASDDLAVRALALGCQLVVPGGGVYPELLPEAMRDRCLHDGSAESIVERVLDAWYLEPPVGLEFLIDEALAPFEAIQACKTIDDRLEKLAHPPRPTLLVGTALKPRQIVGSTRN
jgi:hypothetical protein